MLERRKPGFYKILTNKGLMSDVYWDGDIWNLDREYHVIEVIIPPRVITLEYIKTRIADFIDKTFGVDRPFTAPLHHLKKEVDETIESGEMEEFADMQLLLLDAFRKRFPNEEFQALINECDRKLDILYTREWNEPDENGVYLHKK